MKKIISTCIALMVSAACSISAFAMEVPTNTTIQDLNGVRQYIKIYTVAPDTDPQSLIDDVFEYDGYTYTYSSMTKEERSYSEKEHHTETVTADTEKSDLSVVLKALSPSIEYDDGEFRGTLYLDHSTISTVASGYTTKSYTVSATKEIDNLDTNDMAYVPDTTTKNGVTVQLQSVDWQVQGTSLVDDILVPAQYKAVATYAGRASYRAATGYVTTAKYIGDIVAEGIESVTYTVIYTGTPSSILQRVAAKSARGLPRYFNFPCCYRSCNYCRCTHLALPQETPRRIQFITKIFQRRKMNMKSKKRWFVTALTACLTLSLGICVEALEYDFDGVEDTEYYPSTSYESLYGAKYNYGGSNATDYQWPALPYGVSSNTSVGCMEKVRFPGLVDSIGGSGIKSNITNPIQQEPQIPSTSYQPSAYTSVDGMERKDGSIGTLKIPSLNINMKVWEGETNTSMAKGLGHYSSTSGWDGNIGVCGHNRGAKYTIGNIKNLKDGDTITYTTVYGTRTYEVVTVETIASSDWSYLQATSDNRITITTCLANQPSKRVCVQAVEVK